MGRDESASFPLFYSHVICLGTKIIDKEYSVEVVFYSHVICLGTKIVICSRDNRRSFTVT